MHKDLRSFLRTLEEHDDLVHIARPVSVEYEIAAGIRKTSDIGGPALYFEHVTGYDLPVVGGLFSHRRRGLLGVGSSAEEWFSHYRRGLRNPIKPILVDRGPCKEVVLTGADADLTKLPICTYSRKDGGAFITMGLQVANDPEFGRNITISRMQLFDGQTTGILASIHQNLGMYYDRAEKRGEPLEVAVALGCDPCTTLATQFTGSIFVDEYDIAGGLMGSPVEIVKCETIDVEVPATSEIVIEGVMLPHERREEGPFGEFPGYYSGSSPKQLFKVTAITHRRNPIFLAGLTGMPITDNHVMRQMSWEPLLYDRLRSICPTVKDVCFTDGGTGTMHVAVSMKPMFKSQARDVMLAAFQTERIRPKLVIVVDDDVDVRDPRQVEWAMAYRMQGDRDILIIPNGIGNALDPSCPEPRVSALVGIDATIPFGEAYPEVCDVPGAAAFEIPGWTDAKPWKGRPELMTGAGR